MKGIGKARLRGVTIVHLSEDNIVPRSLERPGNEASLKGAAIVVLTKCVHTVYWCCDCHLTKSKMYMYKCIYGMAINQM